MKQLYEYLLNKSKAKDVNNKVLSFEEFEDKFSSDGKAALDAIKRIPKNGYKDVVCDLLLDLYNEGYEYKIWPDRLKFDNASEKSKCIYISGAGLGFTEVRVEIYNVEKMIQLCITMTASKLLVQTGNLPEKSYIEKRISGDGGLLFSCIFVANEYDDKLLKQFKNTLNRELKNS